MRDRQERIRDEVGTLWRELFGEPAPACADGPAMLDVILQRMPDRAYERLASPYLRPSQIRGPGDGRSST